MCGVLRGRGDHQIRVRDHDDLMTTLTRGEEEVVHGQIGHDGWSALNRHHW